MPATCSSIWLRVSGERAGAVGGWVCAIPAAAWRCKIGAGARLTGTADVGVDLEAQDGWMESWASCCCRLVMVLSR